MSHKLRVVIYVRGTAEEIAQQLAECTALCERRGYEIGPVARDLPGETSAWYEAGRLIRAGKVDQAVMASASLVPEHLESATGSMPGPGAAGAHRARPLITRLRRTRRVQRPEA